MKIKRKELSLIIVMILMLSIFSGCNTNTEIQNAENEETVNSSVDEIWVLTYEKTQNSDEFSEASVSKETEYGYNSVGHLVSEETHYQNNDYISYDFSYNAEGNVVSKSVKSVDYYTDNTSFSNWSYQYDVNGNCIKTSVLWIDNNAQDISEYQYDQHGNVIKEHVKYLSNDFSYEIIKTATLTYEDNLCIQSEFTNEEIDDNGSNISYSVYQYTYDSNGNLASRHYYTDIDSIDDARNPIEINGKYYKLYDTTYYTYERLEDVAIENINTENNNSENQQAETTTKAPKKLSDECDKILGTGQDNDGNYYELVATETEDYNGLVIKIGVIKNNEWLVNLTTDNPLLDDDYTIFGGDLENIIAEYVADNCFFVRQSYERTGYGRIYNFSLNVASEYVYNMEYQGPLARPCYSSTGEILLHKDNYAQPNFTILDTKTMTTKEINVGYVDYFAPVSEGFFAVINKVANSNILTFYNTNGEKVLEFPQYDAYCKKTDGNWIFVNGKCKFTISNNNDTIYEITIDKEGNVINSVQQ